MDCCVCSPTAVGFRLPRNSICVSCYEGARCMIVFLNDLENGRSSDEGSTPAAVKGLSNVFKWMKEMKEMEKALNRKAEFLGGFVAALTDALHTDILVQPGGGGAAIPAHRALLAARSEIFKTVLMSDECKAPPSVAISLPELNHDQLQCLLEFLYRGTISEDDAGRHACALLLAADKYDVPFLKSFCESRIHGTLTAANALEVLEVSEACASETLRRTAMSAIVEHAEDIVFSSRFDDFALKNAHLCVEITRMLLRGMRDKRASVACDGRPENSQ
ncbi:unnamed protein product [Spirodela intermedia]|uniref:BTB domain-containing protein n=1 Tax=Spirodela intermedia TaxID=51605 RepID=A0A7I8K746_SPIIN|nr:unnamed protein product [Spirodela intermedia]